MPQRCHTFCGAIVPTLRRNAPQSMLCVHSRKSCELITSSVFIYSVGYRQENRARYDTGRRKNKTGTISIFDISKLSFSVSVKNTGICQGMEGKKNTLDIIRYIEIPILYDILKFRYYTIYRNSDISIYTEKFETTSDIQHYGAITPQVVSCSSYLSTRTWVLRLLCRYVTPNYIIWF